MHPLVPRYAFPPSFIALLTFFTVDCVGETRGLLPATYQCVRCLGIPRPHYTIPAFDRSLKRKMSSATAPRLPSPAVRFKSETGATQQPTPSQMRPCAAVAEELRLRCAELVTLSAAYAMLESELTAKLRGRATAADASALLERIGALDKALERGRAEMLRLSQAANAARAAAATTPS